MALFTLTINNLATPLDHKASEAAVIAQYLSFAAQTVQGAQGTLLSANITDNRGAGTIVGNWNYTTPASLP